MSRPPRVGARHAASPDTLSSKVDPVLLEVLKNEFISVVDEMSTVIGRTARSFAAREGGDYSTTVLASDGRLVARSGVSVWYVPNTMPWVLDRYGEQFADGDIVVSNNPFTGGTHLLDVILVMPVFCTGRLVGFVGDSLHHTDLGGFAAGGMSPLAIELHQEGLLLPRVLLHEAGRPVEAVFEIIRASTRAPDDVMADLDGQIAACLAGRRALARLATKHGIDVLQSYFEHLIGYTERAAVRGAIASIPDGTYTALDLVPAASGVPPVKLVLTLHKLGEEMTLDFTGTDPQSPSAINVPPATVAGNALQSFHQLFAIDVPANAGLLAPFRIVAPEGTAVNPRFPAAVGARSAITTKLSDLFFSALAKGLPERVPAAGPTAAIMLYTPDGDRKSRPQGVFDLWLGSRGARPRLDGIDGPGGINRRIPGEVMERDAPVVLEGHGLMSDTGGAGRFRGGLATFRRWRFLRSGKLYIRNLGAGTRAYGLAGGQPGSAPLVLLKSQDTTTDYSDADVTEVRVSAGDSLLHVLGGGGGFGDPLTRDPKLVLADVLDERVSVAHAAEAYGVVIAGDPPQVEEVGTAALRSRLAGEHVIEGQLQHRVNSADSRLKSPRDSPG